MLLMAAPSTSTRAALSSATPLSTETAATASTVLASGLRTRMCWDSNRLRC